MRSLKHVIANIFRRSRNSWFLPWTRSPSNSRNLFLQHNTRTLAHTTFHNIRETHVVSMLKTTFQVDSRIKVNGTICDERNSDGEWWAHISRRRGLPFYAKREVNILSAVLGELYCQFVRRYLAFQNRISLSNEKFLSIVCPDVTSISIFEVSENFGDLDIKYSENVRQTLDILSKPRC